MDYLKLNTKEYPFLFGLRAQKEMMSTDVKDKDDIFFFWLGLKYGAYIEKLPFDMTEDDLITEFELDMDGYANACQLLGEHMGKLKKTKALATKAMQGNQ